MLDFLAVWFESAWKCNHQIFFVTKIAKLTWPGSWCHQMSKHLKDDSFGLHLTFFNTHQTHNTDISVRKFFFIHRLRTSFHNFQKFTCLEISECHAFVNPQLREHWGETWEENKYVNLIQKVRQRSTSYLVLNTCESVACIVWCWIEFGSFRACSVKEVFHTSYTFQI